MSCLSALAYRLGESLLDPDGHPVAPSDDCGREMARVIRGGTRMTLNHGCPCGGLLR
jgi:hypothetical protein